MKTKRIKRPSPLLVAIAMIISLASCSKENLYEKRIIGQWYCTEETADLDFSFMRRGNCYEFTENGVVYIWESGYERDKSVGRYEIKEETLIIDFLVTWPYTIDKLSKKTMTLLTTSGDQFSLQKTE